MSIRPRKHIHRLRPAETCFIYAECAEALAEALRRARLQMSRQGFIVCPAFDQVESACLHDVDRKRQLQATWSVRAVESQLPCEGNAIGNVVQAQVEISGEY